ncbi:hypothetical protein GCM10022243_37420 [Saccharothrix violaceirubra]|uniref:Uncharacterized protein n=1 Tax=Saccharothrix violaceirubra TaxID=413306 RepID=A0A7W7T5H5_9PSEU|nr:hypothetical protein [Saccharothrix violaceirubra]MBB4966342.1 hypothetical protein [Saccharothrix violaceirubra]
MLLLDEEFHGAGQASWTNYREGDVVHSGDITGAADGASEFIDVPLPTTRAAYVVPRVNIFAGESFDDVAESMFGYRLRNADQRGTPFDPGPCASARGCAARAGSSCRWCSRTPGRPVGPWACFLPTFTHSTPALPTGRGQRSPSSHSGRT